MDWFHKARLAGWGSALAALIAALALTVAGCDGSAAAGDSASSSSAPSAPNGPRPELDPGTFTQLRECPKKNGVTLPSPGQGEPPSGGQGGPPALSDEAQKA